MRALLLSLAVLSLAGLGQASEIQLTGFGTAKKNPTNLADDLTGSWSGQGTLTANALDLANVSNLANGSNGLYSDLTLDGRAPVFIGTNTAQLTLTGTLVSPVPGIDRFSISLYDTSGSFHELDYTFRWSAFQSGGSTGIAIPALLSGSQGLFNGTVGSWSLNLFDATGTPPATVSANFFDLGVVIAVPEPSTSALLMLGPVLTAAIRRRRPPRAPVQV